VGVTHWDEAERRRLERGQMAATWTNLGTPAGSYRCGVHRIEMAPGEQPTPAHVHGEAEEIFYVLGGSGLTWMDEKAYGVGKGDCNVYKNFREAHTLRAGDDGLDVLAFGAREYFPSGSLPRARVMWGITGAIEETSLDELHPWDPEPPIGWPEPEAERPSTIVNVAEVEPKVHGGRRRRDLGRAVGSRWTGIKYVECERGVLSVVPHVHSMEEEIFVVLEGDGALELLPCAPDGGEVERHPVRPGSVVAQPPGARVAHTFRGGDAGLTLLAWGTREPGDLTYYPRSRKVYFPGGVLGRIEPVDYRDGESLE
jgi:uncharacterized cupin superfamily protein